MLLLLNRVTASLRDKYSFPSCFQLAPRGDAHITVLGHFPVGEAWHAVRIAGKNLYRLIKSFSTAYEDLSAYICKLTVELNPYTTTEMISDWETAVGLPDPCFPSTSTIEERRSWVVFRLDKRRWSTAQDWKDLAELFGLEIVVTPGWRIQKPSVYPPCYPIRYINLPRLGRFHVFLDVVDGCGDDGYPYTYPMTYGFGSRCEALRCIIERVKPANVVVIWNNTPETSC